MTGPNVARRREMQRQGEHSAIVAIASDKLLDGSLPRRVARLVEEWRRSHVAALAQAWKDAQDGKTPRRIAPLEYETCEMKLGNRIRRILKVDAEHYRVRLQFEDGTRETVDLRFLFCRVKRGHLVLEILRGQLFGKCFVESGALAWPNGYEICPDAIRHWIQQQPGQRAA